MTQNRQNVTKTTKDFLMDSWRNVCGLPAVTYKITYTSMEDVYKNNWFYDAIIKARNRMVIGFFRYGNFKDPEQPNYDRISSIKERINAYEETGNTEHLLDVLNLCGIEFETPKHPNTHFTPIDDDIHTKVKGE